jgi:hypothetical protein
MIVVGIWALGKYVGIVLMRRNDWINKLIDNKLARWTSCEAYEGVGIWWMRTHDKWRSELESVLVTLNLVEATGFIWSVFHIVMSMLSKLKCFLIKLRCFFELKIWGSKILNFSTHCLEIKWEEDILYLPVWLGNVLHYSRIKMPETKNGVQENANHSNWTWGRVGPFQYGQTHPTDESSRCMA